MEWLTDMLREIGSLTDDGQLTRGILFVAGSIGAAWVTLRRIFAKPHQERVKIDAPANVRVNVEPIAETAEVHHWHDGQQAITGNPVMPAVDSPETRAQLDRASRLLAMLDQVAEECGWAKK